MWSLLILRYTNARGETVIDASAGSFALFGGGLGVIAK
jgi:hypothetical protein